MGVGAEHQANDAGRDLVHGWSTAPEGQVDLGRPSAREDRVENVVGWVMNLDRRCEAHLREELSGRLRLRRRASRHEPPFHPKKLRRLRGHEMLEATMGRLLHDVRAGRRDGHRGPALRRHRAKGRADGEIAHERSNPAGVVDLVALHDMGTGVPTADDQIRDLKAMYAEKAKRPFVTASCGGR